MNEYQSLKPFYEAKPKILIRRVINRQDRLMAAYFDERLVFKKDLNPFVITNRDWNAKFVLAILNSRLISYLYVNSSSIATKDDFRQTTLTELRRLPIPFLRSGNPKHDHIVGLVETMLHLNQQLPNAAPTTRTVLQRQIDATDRQIDHFVYELYGLTADEIALVEQGTN